MLFRSLGFEDVINFILDALPVTNLKPDTEEAEDGTLMSMVINAAEGDDGGASTLALYRQTVSLTALSLLRAPQANPSSRRSCFPPRCQRLSSA